MSTPTDETTFYPAIEQSERLGKWSGKSVPRKEDKRLLKGQGAFVDDLWMHRQGHVHFVRSPYAHARITAIDVSRCEAVPGVYATLTGEEVGELQQPYFQMAPEPAGADEGLLHGRRQGPLHGRAGRRGARRVGRAGARRRRADRGQLRAAAGGGRRDRHDRARRARAARGDRFERRLARHLRLRRHRLGDRERRPRRADRPPALPPVLLDAARDQRRAGQLGPRHRSGRVPHEQPDADVRGDVHRAGDRPRHRSHAVLEPGHRRRLRDQDHQLHLPDRAGAALAQGRPPGEVERVALGAPRGLGTRQRADLPRHRGAGDERRHDPRLQGPGVRRRRRLPALRAARRGDLGAGRARQLPLQARPRRLHRDADEQVSRRTQPRLLAAAAPVDDRADRRHRRPRAGLRPGRAAQAQLRAAGGLPLRDAQRLHLRLRRLSGDARSRARADRLRGRAGRASATAPAAASGSASASARRSTPAPTTSVSRGSSTRRCRSPGTARRRSSGSISTGR